MKWFSWTACVALVAGALVLPACQAERMETGRGAPLGGPERVTAEKVREWMESGETVVVLDSRSDIAWERGSTKAAGAIRVPPNDVASALPMIPETGKLIVYCT